jgi:hypothetical protein
MSRTTYIGYVQMNLQAYNNNILPALIDRIVYGSFDHLVMKVRDLQLLHTSGGWIQVQEAWWGRTRE